MIIVLSNYINFSSYDIEYQPNEDENSVCYSIPKNLKRITVGVTDEGLQKASKHSFHIGTKAGRMEWKLATGCKLTTTLPYTTEELHGKTLIVDAEMVHHIKQLYKVLPFNLWVPHIVSTNHYSATIDVDFFFTFN